MPTISSGPPTLKTTASNMSNQAFSINITSLPPADGLGPVDAQDAASWAEGAQKRKPQAPSAGLPHTSGSAMSQAVGGNNNAMPRRSSSPFAGTTSPSRLAQRSASPRHLSPATSQIFERDVQESTMVSELNSATPAHISIEDAIPAVLEASSLAITDTRLSPDDVEIVMHSSHQPAALGVMEVMDAQTAHAEHAGVTEQQQHPTTAATEEGSTYGAVDPLDPRRLSFISFADVMHAAHTEHADSKEQQHQHPTHPHHFTSLSPSAAGGARSSSPAPALAGLESGGLRRGSASIASAHAQTHGDLTIESMTHALEQPLSVGAVDGGGITRSHR